MQVIIFVANISQNYWCMFYTFISEHCLPHLPSPFFLVSQSFKVSNWCVLLKFTTIIVEHSIIWNKIVHIRMWLLLMLCNNFSQHSQYFLISLLDSLAALIMCCITHLLLKQIIIWCFSSLLGYICCRYIHCCRKQLLYSAHRVYILIDSLLSTM